MQEMVFTSNVLPEMCESICAARILLVLYVFEQMVH